MPKYTHHPPGVVGWLVLSPFIAAFGYALYHLPWVIAALVAIGIVATMVVSNRNFETKLTELAELRSDETICAFARSFNSHEVDTWVIRAVYEQLQTHLGSTHPHFPVHAEDLLYGCLISDPDDLDLDLANEIAQRTGRTLERTQDNPYYGKVTTVRDLVMFFNAQPRTNET